MNHWEYLEQREYNMIQHSYLEASMEMGFRYLLSQVERSW
jgi:hypothetical protein